MPEKLNNNNKGAEKLIRPSDSMMLQKYPFGRNQEIF